MDGKGTAKMKTVAGEMLTFTLINNVVTVSDSKGGTCNN